MFLNQSTGGIIINQSQPQTIFGVPQTNFFNNQPQQTPNLFKSSENSMASTFAKTISSKSPEELFKTEGVFPGRNTIQNCFVSCITYD